MRAGLLDILHGRFIDGRPLEAAGPEEQMVLSIVGNLDRLFNTRRGFLAHMPDYGLPDMTEIYRDIADDHAELRHLIKQSLEKYEPRLRRVRVDLQRTDPYSMRLEFMVSGELPNRRRIHFQTTFSSHEMVHVQARQRV